MVFVSPTEFLVLENLFLQLSQIPLLALAFLAPVTSSFGDLLNLKTIGRCKRIFPLSLVLAASSLSREVLIVIVALKTHSVS